MKNTTLVSFAFLILSLFGVSCNSQTSLNEEDMALSNQLNFEAQILQEIRNLTDSVFSIAQPADKEELYFDHDTVAMEKFRSKELIALSFKANMLKAPSIVNELRDKVRRKGYAMYISESNFGYAADEICVIKTDDAYDMLRFEATNGANYDIFTEEIITRLKTWDKKYGLKFVGVGFDFVEADYSKTPVDIDRLAEELYEFCPDIVDQGVGSIEELKRETINTKKLFLWWD